jgi:hypothetical protein
MYLCVYPPTSVVYIYMTWEGFISGFKDGNSLLVMSRGAPMESTHACETIEWWELDRERVDGDFQSANRREIFSSLILRATILDVIALCDHECVHQGIFHPHRRHRLMLLRRLTSWQMPTRQEGRRKRFKKKGGVERNELSRPSLAISLASCCSDGNNKWMHPKPPPLQKTTQSSRRVQCYNTHTHNSPLVV